jgi:biopolymer transport protein ExbD
MHSFVAMRFFLLLFILSLFQQCRENNSNESLPERRKKSINVTATADDKIFIGKKAVPLDHLDSILEVELIKLRDDIHDTVTVVIGADTATSYGLVFKIMNSAKRFKTKVVARID